MNRGLLICVLAALGSAISAQDKLTAELFIDSDPGYGNGTQFDAQVGDNTFTIPLTGVVPGAHLISVRAQKADGQWSATVTNPLYISNEQLFIAAEYFIDEDPGQNKATPIPNAVGKTLTFNVPTTGLSYGLHSLSIRVQAPGGQWSDVMTEPFIVAKSALIAGGLLEYFIDADPGFGNGEQVEVSDDETIIFIPTANITPGAHLISVRTRDNDGHWSATVTNPLYVSEPIEILSAEYFVDTDPGEGMATSVTVPDNGNISFSVPTTFLQLGTHQLVLRGRMADGRYVRIFEAPFTISEVGGIQNVQWSSDVKISRQGNTINIESETHSADTSRWKVEIYDTRGLRLLSETSVPVHFNTAGRPGPFIVSVTTSDASRYVQLIR